MDKQDKLTRELVAIENKLIYLRQRYKEGSPGMKAYIFSTAKLVIEKRDKLKIRLEKFLNGAVAE